MTLRSFERQKPLIAANAYIDPQAAVIGRVEIGEHSSIWPMTVVRGDVNEIVIGAHTSIQDGSVVHVTHEGEMTGSGFVTNVGNYVTVGHKVILHGCTIADYCLIGMGAIVMDGARIEENVLIAAGSLVPPGKVCESGFLWVGSPVKKVRLLTEKEIQFIRYSAEHYVKLKNRYRTLGLCTK